MEVMLLGVTKCPQVQTKNKSTIKKNRERKLIGKFNKK